MARLPVVILLWARTPYHVDGIWAPSRGTHKFLDLPCPVVAMVAHRFSQVPLSSTIKRALKGNRWSTERFDKHVSEEADASRSPQAAATLTRLAQLGTQPQASPPSRLSTQPESQQPPSQPRSSSPDTDGEVTIVSSIQGKRRRGNPYDGLLKSELVAAVKVYMDNKYQDAMGTVDYDTVIIAMQQKYGMAFRHQKVVDAVKATVDEWLGEVGTPAAVPSQKASRSHTVRPPERKPPPGEQ